MAKLLAVLINWSLRGQLKMISLALNVVTVMADNPLTFVTPEVVLSVLKTAATRLQDAYNGRKMGDAGKAEYINAAEALDILLHNQAFYVDGIAKGDASIIAKSGFKSTTNVIVKKVICGKPDPAALKTPSGGGLKITLQKVLGATSYIFVVFFGAVGTIVVGKNFVKPSGESIVITKGKLKESLTGIPPGTQVTVIPFAQNSAGISVAGIESTIMVN